MVPTGMTVSASPSPRSRSTLLLVIVAGSWQVATNPQLLSCAMTDLGWRTQGGDAVSPEIHYRLQGDLYRMLPFLAGEPGDRLSAVRRSSREAALLARDVLRIAAQREATR